MTRPLTASAFGLLISLFGYASVFAQQAVCLALDNINGLETYQALNDDFKSHSLVLLGEAPHNIPANTYLHAEFFNGSGSPDGR